MDEEVRASLLKIKFVKETSADPCPISPFGKGVRGISARPAEQIPLNPPVSKGDFSGGQS